MNDLATILDDTGARAEVQKWLVDSWLARQEYDSGLASSAYADELVLPENKGQDLEVSRKGQPRRPQHLSNSSPESDPASGMLLSEAKVRLPIEYIQEYVGIGMTAQITSRHDLEVWAKDDLPEALKRRFHELTQNAFKVGRMTPGVWSAVSTVATTPFDATAEATPTINGVSYTFGQAHHSFAGGKTSLAALAPGDRVCMADFERECVRLRMKGAAKIKGRYIAFISESTKRELMKDPGYRAAVLAWNGKGLAENQIADYAGIHWMEDDNPFTESFSGANVRATNGQIHTSIVFGAHAFAYLRLGGKSSMKPTFKIQDTTKTGVYKTLGYTIPFQVGIVNGNWCGTIAAPVSFYDPDNM